MSGNKTTYSSPYAARSLATVAVCGCLLTGAPFAALADAHAEARFTGTGKADPIRITNVKCAPADVTGVGVLTFDVAWDHSWRATWEEPAGRTGGAGPLGLENWDAAWVFVKFRNPGAEWAHATLSAVAGDHTVPAGAALDVGLSDDPDGSGAGGKRGLGVFLYRGSPGSGGNTWQGVKLRWMAGADGVASLDKVAVSQGTIQATDGMKPKLDAGNGGVTATDALLDGMLATMDAITADAVAVRVFAIKMVYVPEGAFWVGDGSTNGIANQFTAGDSDEPFRVETEGELTLGGTDRRNLGNHDGIGMFRTEDFGSFATRILPARFPKGFAAFYCMRHEMTKGQYAEFLNTLSFELQGEYEPTHSADGVTTAALTVVKPGEPGVPTVYGTSTPHMALPLARFTDVMAYSAWAGLRPLTELEYEKACRGPLKPVPNEYAWGTAAIAGEEYRRDDGPHLSGYVIKKPGTPAECVEWEGGSAPDAVRGNAAWEGARRRSNYWGVFADALDGPVRSEIFATPTSDRVAAGASYWGIMELSGNLLEMMVTIGNPQGRTFGGWHGEWPEATQKAFDGHVGVGTRGGCFWSGSRQLRVSDRSEINRNFMGGPGGGNPVNRDFSYSFRCARTAAAGRTPVEQQVAADESLDAAARFNDYVRIANVSVKPRDATTAAVTFDIAWDDSWRNSTNHDAAWVFFKTRADGKSPWQHVRLAADKVLNPTGYGQTEGDKVEFVVPAGTDGFTGVFVRRAAPGSGPLSAKGVSVVCDASFLNPQIQAFGLLMVYVAEGPFFLGSGGSEPQHFYMYTDGSQDTLPYRVTGPGPVPTGPQPGRLWASGRGPDASDAGEIPTTFPNGYRAFYCMKHMVTQGQAQGCMGMNPNIEAELGDWRRGRWPCTNVKGNFLAWSGLRPMTELEYEKACRGPREPVPNDAPHSYWGVERLNAGDLILGTVAVTPGFAFRGTHGSGDTTSPEDWSGNGYCARGAARSVGVGGHAGFVRTSDRSVVNDQAYGMEELFGVRGVRTAPVEAATARPPAAAGAPGRGAPGLHTLELDPLPDLREADVTIFYLAGRFRNGGDKPLQVEIAANLPAEWFPGGVASRSLTAAPKAATPFKIPAIVTRRALRLARNVQMLPVSVVASGGESLAEANVKAPLADPLAFKPPPVGTVEGGVVTLLVKNAADGTQRVTIELPAPPGVDIPETERRIELAAGAEASAVFPVRSHVFLADRFLRVPFRASLAQGAPVTGETAVVLQVQSRWWIGQRPPKAFDGGGSPESAGKEDAVLDQMLSDVGLTGADDDPRWALPPGLFKQTAPPGDWRTVIHGASLWMGHLSPEPFLDGIVSAATRVWAPSDREVTINVGRETPEYVWLDDAILCDRRGDDPRGIWPPDRLRREKPAHFIGRIWLNGAVVYDSRPDVPAIHAPARLLKGQNTMLVLYQVNDDKPPLKPNVETQPQRPVDVYVLFRDPVNGKCVDGLIFDIEKK